MFNSIEIEEKIKKYCELENKNMEDIFFDGATLLEISAVEEKLGVKLPNSYKWFLENYGSGGIGGMEFWGIENNKKDVNSYTVVSITEEYRRKGLELSLIVFEENGEYITCMDTSKMDENNECPVVTWSNYDLDGIVFKEDNFYSYFLERIDDYL